MSLSTSDKSPVIRLLSIATPQMRAFHITWVSFFCAFFGWFGVAPLMVILRDDLGLTKEQIGNTIIASVAATILARLVVGWLCDRLGPRLVYTGLLMVGSIPVMTIGLAQNYESFLLFRLAIGVIGASFVITQYHTSLMFAPNVVGTANATTAGWGNLGGGVTQMVMPLVFAALLGFGIAEGMGWRLAMAIPGAVLFLMGIVYYRLTQDTPEGNYSDLRKKGMMPTASAGGVGSFLSAAKDHRVWALFIIYGACFGVELIINNIAALYFYDRFGLGIGAAGMIAGLFGLMNIFSRSTGGIFSDKASLLWGLRGRVMFLGIMLLLEGFVLILFSQMATLFTAVATMIVFGIFVQMSSGATFSVVPFINKQALGSVAGIVGAGGNAGAMFFGFLFRMENLQTETALLYLGILVSMAAGMVFLVRFSEVTEGEERVALEAALIRRGGLLAAETVSVDRRSAQLNPTTD